MADYVSQSNDAPPDGNDYTPVDNFSLTNTQSAPTSLDNSNAYGTANSQGQGWGSLNDFIVTGGGSSLDNTVATIPTAGQMTYEPTGTSGTALTATSNTAGDWTRAILGALNGVAPVVSSLAQGNTPVVNPVKTTPVSAPDIHGALIAGIAVVLAYLLLT